MTYPHQGPWVVTVREPEDWRCECGDLNRAHEWSCYRCGAGAPDDAREREEVARRAFVTLEELAEYLRGEDCFDLARLAAMPWRSVAAERELDALLDAATGCTSASATAPDGTRIEVEVVARPDACTVWENEEGWHAESPGDGRAIFGPFGGEGEALEAWCAAWNAEHGIGGAAASARAIDAPSGGRWVVNNPDWPEGEGEHLRWEPDDDHGIGGGA